MGCESGQRKPGNAGRCLKQARGLAYHRPTHMAKKARQRSTGLPRDRIRIDFVVLGDFAQATNGKLTIVGAGWTLYNATQYPALVPFGLGIGILVPWTDTNVKHEFTFRIEGNEHQELAKGGGTFEVGRQPGTPQGMAQRVTFGIAGQLQIPGPGTYKIAVACADDKKGVTFQALPVSASPLLR